MRTNVLIVLPPSCSGCSLHSARLPTASLDSAGAVPSSSASRSKYGEVHRGKQMRRAAATWQTFRPEIPAIALTSAVFRLWRPPRPGAALATWGEARQSLPLRAHRDAPPARSPDLLS